MSDVIAKLTYNKAHQQAVRELSGDAYRIWSYVQLQSDTWKAWKKDICEQLGISTHSYSKIWLPELRTKGWVFGHNTKKGWINEFVLHPTLNPSHSRLPLEGNAPLLSQGNGNSIKDKTDKNTNVFSPTDDLANEANPPTGGDSSKTKDLSHIGTLTAIPDEDIEINIQDFANGQNSLRNNVLGKPASEIELVKPVIVDEVKQSVITAPFMTTEHIAIDILESNETLAIDFYMATHGQPMKVDNRSDSSKTLFAVLNELGLLTKAGTLTKKAKHQQTIMRLRKSIKDEWVDIARQRLDKIESEKARRTGITDVLSQSPFNLLNGRLGKVTQAIMAMTQDKPVTGDELKSFAEDWKFRNAGISTPLGADTLPTAILNYRDSQEVKQQVNNDFIN